VGALTEFARIEPRPAPPAPGEVLKEQLLERSRLTQAELARAFGISSPRLAMMLSGRCQVSAEIALRIERVFDIPANFWLNVRLEHELYEQRRRLSSVLAELPVRHL
jgi:addiction module HigA family antidote